MRWEEGYLFHIDLVIQLSCLSDISQILVTCGFETEVLMGLAAVSRVSRDEVKEEEMMFTVTGCVGSQTI